MLEQTKRGAGQENTIMFGGTERRVPCDAFLVLRAEDGEL